MKIINWQPLFTDHQLYTWRAVQTLITEPIKHVVATAVDATRTKQGWKGADFSGLDIEYLKEKGWWRHGVSIIRANPDAVHVFCGYWAERRYFPLIVYALFHKANVLIIQESFSSESVGYLNEGKRYLNAIKAKARPLLYRAASTLIMLAARGKKPALLAISLRAVVQFKQAGLSDEQVFPFGYFVPVMPLVTPPKPRTFPPIKLIFVGSLLPTKGLDVAVAAVTHSHEQGIPVTLDVYGVGDASQFITSATRGVTYQGTIPFGEAQSVIAQYDALILPSRHDGWGVVVNEALLQGVPVIASSNVGSRCLIEVSGAGAIFPNEDVEALQKILQQLVASPAQLDDWRKNARQVQPNIQPSVAAQYMNDVIDFHFYQIGARPKLLCCGVSL